MDITLPSGAVFDFGDLSQEDIAERLTTLRNSNPELFQETTAAETQSEGPPDPATTPYEELAAYYKERGSESVESDIGPTTEGQVTDSGVRYEFGKRDNAVEQEEFLTQVYGPDSFVKDNRGRYLLNLDNISPEVKAQQNLPESGTMWFNKPGGGFLGLFDMPDIVEFGGKYRGELIGGTALALATGGAGLIVSSLAIGAGAGLGKGLDELQEVLQGTQRQTPDEIYGDVATAAAWNAGGNFIVGGAIRTVGKLVRGPGNPDAQVISDLMDQGLTASQAKAAAVQMQRTATRDAIKGGARPTIQEATGKSVLGRLQAIQEAIFPNKKAARANRKYVQDLIQQYKNGQLSDDAFGAALDQNAKDVSRLISNTMKDPDEAVRLANQQLRDVIEQEMNLLKQVYTTGDETAAAFQNEMTRMVRLWQNNNKELYDNAGLLMDDVRLFDAEKLITTVNNQLKAPLAAEQGLANNPVYQYILNKTDNYTLGELQTLRSAVQNSRSGSLVGDVTDNQLKGLSDKLDDMFNTAELKINELKVLAENGQLTYQQIGKASPTSPEGAQLGVDVLGREFLTQADAAAFSKQLTNGLVKFKDAQKHYKEGAEVFKTGAMNMLNQNVKEGFFADLSAVVESVVQPNKPQLLLNYLKGVTPDATVRGSMQSVPETQWLAMTDAARQGNITEVNRLLGANFPELAGGGAAEKTLSKIGLGLRPPKFIESLPSNDPYRQRILGELAETFQLHADDAAAAASGAAHRDVSRQALASTWIKSAVQQADDLGTFDPAAFRRSFDGLGKDVKDALFGQVEAKRLGSVLKDFALMAPDPVQGGFRFGSVAPSSITNPNMRNIVQNLQADVAEAQAQSSSALFNAVKTGRVDDADALVQAAVKDPKLVDELINKVPLYTLDEPFGLKDAMMSRIIREAFPKGITEEAVASGAWREGMAASIANLNQRGSLSKVLGQDVVTDLVKLTKIPVGDQALKGKGGLSAPTYVAGLGIALIANPAATIPSVAGIFVSSRVLRQKWFLNLLTKPNIRAGELRKGIRALADDLMAKARADGVKLTRKDAITEAKKQLGNLSVFRRQVNDVIGKELRLITSTYSSGAVDSDDRRAVGETVSGAIDAARPVVQDIRQQIPNAAAAAQQMSPLRQVEQNKLMGIGVNQ
tara:strand:- start:5876 stop:9340 length:3465 start_codon:yes stop_codon:yes gene_type:complete